MADANFVTTLPLPYTLCDIFLLNPVKYNFTGDARDYLGHVAQEVEPIIPEIVVPNVPDEKYSLRVDGFLPLIIRGIQQIKPQTDDNAARLTVLEDYMDEMEGWMDDLELWECYMEGDNAHASPFSFYPGSFNGCYDNFLGFIDALTELTDLIILGIGPLIGPIIETALFFLDIASEILDFFGVPLPDGSIYVTLELVYAIMPSRPWDCGRVGDDLPAIPGHWICHTFIPIGDHIPLFPYSSHSVIP